MAGVSSSSSCVVVAAVTGVVVVVTAVVVRGALLVAGLAEGRFCAVADRGSGDAAGSAPCDCADLALGVSVVVLKSHWKSVGSCFKLVVPAGAPGNPAVFAAEKAESAAPPPAWGSADEEAPDR